MKIMFTGGATGGHFYPIIAIAEALRDIEEKERMLPADLYFVSDSPYDTRLLFEHDIQYVSIKSGKRRTYFSILNYLDIFKTTFAIIRALFIVYGIFPDVVFGKGGYASFPALFAARLLGIPVIIHESDAVPGRVNLWAAKFAKAVAVAYPEAAKYFPKGNVIVTGCPLRREVMIPIFQGAHQFLNLEEGVPVILVLGGSQGAAPINELVLDALPFFLDKYQIVHQVGEANKKEVEGRLEGVIGQNPHKDRYKMFPYLNDLALRMSAGVADFIISRAGSTIFEIATWGKPSIVIPLSDSHADHQRKNAYHYARTGAALVLEEANLTPRLIFAEIERVFENKKGMEDMSKAARKFGEHNVGAAEKLARGLVRIELQHEQ